MRRQNTKDGLRETVEHWRSWGIWSWVRPPTDALPGCETKSKTNFNAELSSHGEDE